MSTDARQLPAPLAAAAETRRRRAGRQRLMSRGLLYAGASLLALWILIPIYLITVSAFSPSELIYAYPHSLIPQEISTETMQFFANFAGVYRSLWNSVQVALVTLVMSMVIGAPAGYAIARFAFRGRNAYRLLILSTRAFPIVILSIPLAVAFISGASTTRSGRWP